MAIQTGSHVGPYKVLSALGAGGMGEVYRARDTRLHRDVAIKVLLPAVATDPDRLARFTREAHVLASLNHPHIAGIHGLEEASGITALVLELVEGETLAERITRGALPVEEALPIARQIAEAVQAAHEQGIIHRDLKPANIKVTPEGTVKVLDFGLAKLAHPDTTVRHADVTASATITSPALMTGAGMLLGTAAYMSPEQAKGREADKRSDVWSFGCVLYEMLTGRRPFDGEDVHDTLANVLKVDPDWLALPPSVPAAIRVLLHCCLTKDRRGRVADLSTALFVLENGPRLAPVAGAAAAAPLRSRRLWRRVAAPAGVAVIVATIATAATWLATRPAPPSVIRTTIPTSGATVLALGGTEHDLAITPDGARVVYRGNNQLFVRALNQLEPTVLSGLGRPRGVFIAPDGQWIGFVDGTLLKKVAMTGGPSATVSVLEGAPRGATWSEDGTVIFATALPSTGLYRVSAIGGAPQVLTTPDRARGEGDHYWPEFLPGGGAVLFTITPATGRVDDSQIAVLDLRTGAQNVLVRGGSHARYVPSGHLVYGVAGTLRAVAFDLDRLEARGIPVPVVSQMVTTTTGAANFDVAENGMLAYVSGGVTTERARRTLAWVDRLGREEPLQAPARAYAYPRLSPDATRVALAVRDEQDDIWAWDLVRETLTRITFDPGVDNYPVWMPDGRRLLFSAPGDGGQQVMLKAADGTGTTVRLTDGPTIMSPLSVSPDGDRVVVREGTSSYDLGVFVPGKERRATPLVQTAFSELNAEISPDGRWLAYESDESGRREIYVRPFPNGADGRWQVSGSGGSKPLWARNGQELFYLTTAGEDATMMSVRVERGAAWQSGPPTALFSGRFFQNSGPGTIGEGRTYDVSPDGQRFLMIKRENADAAVVPVNIVVVQNWFEELKRLVPTN